MTLPITWIGSTNKTPGRSGLRPEAIVIHIMDGSLRGTDEWFNTPKGPRNRMPVSAHYGIGRSGVIHQYVDEMDTAWHAGRVKGSTWSLLKPRPAPSPNAYTVGIEHEGRPSSTWTEAMYQSSATLVAGIAQRWSIPLDRAHVIGHNEIFADKAYCPGPRCSLDLLLDLAHHVVLSGATNNIGGQPGRVTTTRDLNVRLGAPSSLAARVRLMPRGTEVAYTGWTSNGESVHGNAHWYRDAEGNYFWAGGTAAPVPSS